MAPSNVVSLYDYEDEEPQTPPSLESIIETINEWAKKNGKDTGSIKYKYEMATLMTLLKFIG